MRMPRILALVALSLVACSTGGGRGSMTLAVGHYSADMASYSLLLYQGTPANATDEPAIEYLCRSYQNDGFRVSNIEPGTDYYVVFKGYADADCTRLAYVGVRGGITVSEDASTAGRYYLSLLKVGASTLLADPKYSTLGQLNGVSCKAEDKCSTYFAELASAVCSPASKMCRVMCATDADCTSLHPKAVCDDDGVDTYCVFPDAYPLNNAVARGFSLGVPLSDGTVGLVGGLAEGTDGRLAAASVPIESYDGVTGVFDAPAETGFQPTAFGGAVRLRKDAWAVVGGLSSVGLASNADKGLDLSLCADGVASCGFAQSVQVFDFAKGKSFASDLAIDIDPSAEVTETAPIGVALPVVWRLNDGVAALFGGIGFQGGTPSMSRNGLLCSYTGYPDVTCSAYNGVLNGPRAGHAGLCLEASGTIPFSCDRFLVLGGNSPDTDTTLADLMVVEKSAAGNYSIKPQKLTLTAGAADDPVAHAFGLEPVRLGDDLWITVGGARYLPGTVGFAAPDLGVYGYDIDDAALTITPRPLAVQDLPTGGAALLHRVMHTVVTGSDDTGTYALVVGGLGADGKATDSVLVLRDVGGAPALTAQIQLSKARLGATVTPFENPFLTNAWLVSGGFRVAGGKLLPVYGSEIVLGPLD